MELKIDGLCIQAQPGQTLLQMIEQLGLGGESLSTIPIAAKIAGEVFNLNYVPVRPQDVQQERSSIRRAMLASGGVINLIRYTDPAGRDVYDRTVQFVIFLALHRLCPNAFVKMNCTVGRALYVDVRDDVFCVDTLKREVSSLIEQNIPLIRKRITTKEAIAQFAKQGKTDKARLLSWRTEEYFDIYSYEDFADYYYGELAPSTGYIKVWDIIPADGVSCSYILMINAPIPLQYIMKCQTSSTFIKRASVGVS